MASNGDTIESRLQTHQYNIVFRDPESVLKKYLGNNLKIVNYESEPLTELGENYGSTVMKIIVYLKEKNEVKVQKLHLIGKLLPPTDFYREFFESNFTFQKETFFYERLIPTYQEIYKKEFNIVPQYYGSRMALEHSEDVLDEDAVLLLENLKIKGYYTQDRHKGLDFEHLRILISAIAKFHAIGLSVKHKNPSFVPYLEKYTRCIAMSDVQKNFIEKMINDVKKHPEVKEYYGQVKSLYKNSENGNYYYLNKTLALEEPWACVVHLDLWTNNMLFHRDETGKVDDVKIIDFQTCAISSPLVDVVFLLCTSMQHPMEHFDAIIELYRKTVCEVLEELDLDASLFSKEKFEERLKIDAVPGIFHVMIMTYVAEYHKGDDFLNKPASELVIRRWKRICEIYKQKEWF